MDTKVSPQEFLRQLLTQDKPPASAVAEEEHEVLLDDRLQELQFQMLELEDRKKQAYKEWREECQLFADCEQEMVELLKAKGAEQTYDDAGNRFKVTEKTDRRKVLDDVLLQLKEMVPEKIWDKIHKVKTEHQWHVGNIRRLVYPLGDDFKTLVEEAVVAGPPAIEIKRTKEG